MSCSKVRRRFVVVLAMTALVLGASLAPARAQEGAAGAEAADEEGIVHSWALAPAGAETGTPAGSRPNLSYDLAPGTQTDDAVTLFNFGNVQLTFFVYATDAFNNADGAFDLLPGDQRPTDVGTWVTLPQASITVPPGDQVTFPITIRVPVDAVPGDHAGAILAASAAQGTAPDGKVVTLDRRTGSRLYVRVAGPLAPELAVEDLRTTYSPGLNPLDGRAEISYSIRNRGNIRLTGSHQASVSGPFGLAKRSAGAEELPELLPGQRVTYSTTLDGVAATGLTFTRVELDPVAVVGDLGDLPSGDKRSLLLTVPFTVLALGLAAALTWYARRSYLHRQGTGIVAGQQPT